MQKGDVLIKVSITIVTLCRESSRLVGVAGVVAALFQEAKFTAAFEGIGFLFFSLVCALWLDFHTGANQ